MTTKTPVVPHSSYWLDDDHPEEVGVVRIAKLASIRRAISNFVRILTNKSSIVVRYSSGKDSYTNGETVVLSADTNTKNFDSMVGVALHEGSHILLTDFEFLKTLHSSIPSFYSALSPKLRAMLPVDADAQKNSEMISELRNVMKMLLNIIEDRRIDSYVYKNAPGYRPYYDSMYARHFINPETEKNMKRNPAWRIPSVEMYMNWLILMISPSFDSKALPGLGKMLKIVDIPNIRKYDQPKMPRYNEWTMDGSMPNIFAISSNFSAAQRTDIPIAKYSDFPLIWQSVNELMILILRYSQLGSADKSSVGLGDISISLDPSECPSDGLPNLDLPSKPFDEAKAKRVMEKIKSMMNQTQSRKHLSKGEHDQINSLDSASAEIKETYDPVFGNVPCLVTKTVSKEILNSPWFPFSNAYTSYTHNISSAAENHEAEVGVRLGIRMGQVLAHKLQIRNDPQVSTFTRQAHGKIDRRLLSQLGMDIEQVFKKTTVDLYNPVLLYLSIDGSASMNRKWEKTMTVATALAYASDKIRNLDVVITLRGTVNSGIPTVAVVYDSRVDKFQKARSMFSYLSPAGATPEGLCFAATFKLMAECAATHRTFFINISDGEPGCYFSYGKQYFNYGGDSAIQQTARMIKQLQELDINIMSYFVSDRTPSPHNTSPGVFKKMYGQHAEFIDVKNLTQILRTLNKLLLIR